MKTADPILRSVAEVVDDPGRRADLFNAFPGPIWFADGAGDCTFVNQAWEDLTGRSVESEEGDRWLASVHEEDRQDVERDWREALGLRRPLDTQYRLMRADGTYGWIHHTAVPINDGSGRLAGYLGTCNDVTEQRVAELGALEKERQIRMLADNVPALIAWFDAVTLKCLFANKAYARMWGWDEMSVLGHTVREVIGEEGYREIEPYVQRAQRG